VPSEKPKLMFVIEPRLLKRIDNFRFKYHFPSRAAAIIWLIKYALDQKPKPEIYDDDDY
jgi:hypothetical protein